MQGSAYHQALPRVRERSLSLIMAIMSGGLSNLGYDKTNEGVCTHDSSREAIRSTRVKSRVMKMMCEYNEKYALIIRAYEQKDTSLYSYLASVCDDIIRTLNMLGVVYSIAWVIA